MPPMKQLADALPEEHLRSAVRAKDPARRLAHAEAGLTTLARRDDDEIDPDIQVLLLRQAYLAHLELRQLRQAADTAERMAEVEGSSLKAVAWADRARALQALGDVEGAIECQRLAARNAPAHRRSFHHWSLATIQHFSGDVDGALASLKKGLRLAQKDRPLLTAHAAYVKLDAGRAVPELQTIRETLAAAPCGQGYGQYLLGMIAHLIGDRAAAETHLRAFLRRNARLDEAKALTLREELRRARLALASFASS